MNPCKVALVASGIQRRRMRPMALSIFLGGDDNQGFELSLPADCARFFAAPVGLVHLDDAIQPIPARTNHGPAQLMQHRPGCLVASQAENALQAQGADAVLLAGDLPHGAKPDRQGQMTVLENGSCRHRHFIPAMIAKPTIAPNRPRIGASASWTDPTARPAQCREVFGASLLAAKAPFQLQQSPRKILVHDPEVYILGLVASSKYP